MDKISKKKPKITVNEACQNRNKSSGHFDKNSTWYKTVIQSSLDGFLLIKHPGGDVLDVNETSSNMLGYSRNELLSMNIRDIEVGFDESSELIKKRFYGIGETGRALFETRHRCKDGRIIDVAVNLRYLDEGLSFCFHRDITEQKKKHDRERARHKKTKIALKETEDRYRTLIELGTKIGEAVIMLQDIDGKEGAHIYVSDLWPQITGYSKEELLRMSFFDLVGSKDRQISVKRHRQKMAGKTIPDLFELSIFCKNGEELPIEITSAATIYKGEPTNVVYIRDITERKQAEVSLALSEKRYQTLFENAPVGLWEIDNSKLKKYIASLQLGSVEDLKEYFRNHPEDAQYGMSKERIIRMNECAENLIGCTIRHFKNIIVEQKYTTKISQEHLEVFVDLVTSLVQGQSIPSCELLIKTPSGKDKYILQHCSVVPGYEDTWSRVIVADVDITDRKETENELLKYKEHLEHIVDERTETLKSEIERRIEYTKLLVHELKTPLMPMLGASEVLSQGLRDEPYASYAKVMYQGSCQLEKRVDELLDIAKGEVGILKLQPSYIEPLELLHEVGEFMNAEAIKHGQNIIIELPSSMKSIYADYNRLNQVLLNIINNAFKFTPEEGAITLRASETAKYAIFEVFDSGIGMDEKTIANLFKPYAFKKAPNQLGGLGLGLLLCKMIVELHSGKIIIESKKDKGTRVCLKIPFILNSPD